MGWLRRLRGWGSVAGRPEQPLSPFEYYGAVADLPPGAVFGAGYAPGFAGDLTCWRLWFYPDGRVVQPLRLCTFESGYRVRRRVEWGQVPPAVAGELAAAAETADLGGLAGRYEAGWTDQCLVSVAARLAGGVRAVAVYGPHALAGEGHAGAAVVLRLWESAARLAPRPPDWLRVADAEPGAAVDRRPKATARD